MLLDLFCAALIALFCLAGYFAGFWIQLTRLAALAGAYLVALFLAGHARSVVGSALGLPPLAARVVALVGIFVITYALFSTLGWIVMKRRRKELVGRHFSLDGVAGALFGGLKATLITYLLLSGLVLLESPLKQLLGRDALGYKSSWAIGLVRRHNLLGHLHIPIAGDLDTLARLGSDRQLQKRAQRDPQVKRLLRHPKVKRAMQDPAVRRAISRGDVSTLLADPRVNALLKDPELRKLAESIDLRKLR